MFYNRCAKIVEEIHKAEAALQSMQEHPMGPLRITAPLTVGYMYFGEIISAFLKAYPDIQAFLVLTDRKVNLIEEGFDVAIRGGILQDSSLIARKLGSADRVMCASPTYLEKRGTPISPTDLREHDCLMYGERPTGGSWRLADGHNVPVEGRLTVNNFDVLKHSALQGLGVAMMPRFMVVEDIESGRLVSVMEEYVNNVGGLYVLYPHARYLSATVRAFVDFIVDYFKGQIFTSTDG